MELTVFDNNFLQRHFLIDVCKAQLQDISERDYPSEGFSFDSRIECLDMDSYERVRSPHNIYKTVDAVIGICACSTNKRKSNPRLLLIELRMGYENVERLSVSRLLGKVAHTRDLLGSELSIERKSCFIFNRKIFNQARRWFSDRGNEVGEFKHFVVYSVDEFNSNILSYDDLPYTPINSPNLIRENIFEWIKKEDVKSLLKSLNYWLKRTQEYKYSNRAEYESMKEVLSEICNEISSITLTMTEDEEIEKDILLDDFVTTFQ